jgi:hypothetical protein
MAYSDFSLREVQQRFDLALAHPPDLFGAVAGVASSAVLQVNLADGLPLAQSINTEKARSEMLIAPILIEVRRQLHYQISLFSGVDFPVDPSQGLSGVCDFILSRSPEQLFIAAPLVTIVEAKNDNPKNGLGQCAAAMVGARLFNQREGNEVARVFGAATTGILWRFLQLEEDRLAIDEREYFISPVDKILGILIHLLRPDEAAASSAA